MSEMKQRKHSTFNAQGNRGFDLAERLLEFTSAAIDLDT